MTRRRRPQSGRFPRRGPCEITRGSLSSSFKEYNLYDFFEIYRTSVRKVQGRAHASAAGRESRDALDASWAPKIPPRAPQDAPRSPQDAPRCLQDAPRSLQDAPRRPQDRPKRAQDAPRSPQDAPKSVPRESKITSRDENVNFQKPLKKRKEKQ